MAKFINEREEKCTLRHDCDMSREIDEIYIELNVAKLFIQVTKWHQHSSKH